MESELLSKARKIYFRLRYEERITDFSKFNDKKDEMKEKYSRKGGLDRYYFDRISEELSKKIDDEFYANVKESFSKYAEIEKVYNNSKRKEIFKKYDEIVEWYKKQECKCGYCGVSQGELKKIVVKRGNNLTLNKLSKRKNGILEIEQRKPVKEDENPYANLENLILACPLCNNAKSNLIDEDSWRKFFVDSMRAYYKKLLNAELINEKP